MDMGCGVYPKAFKALFHSFHEGSKEEGINLILRPKRITFWPRRPDALGHKSGRDAGTGAGCSIAAFRTVMAPFFR